MKRAAIILAAGHGTRLMPYTVTLPKCLLPVGGRPLMDYWLNALEKANVSKVTVTSHAHDKWMQKYVYRVRLESPFHLQEAYEPVLRGSAGAIAINRGLVDDADSVAIIYGDNYSEIDLDALWTRHEAGGAPATMLLFRPDNAAQASAVLTDQDHKIVKFTEKAPAGTPSDGAFAGVLIASADVYRRIADSSAHDLGFDVLPALAPGMAARWTDAPYADIGSHESYRLAQVMASGGLALKFPTARKAVFFDRDGTLIKDNAWRGGPDAVELLPGAAEAVKHVKDMGYLAVMASNQGGISAGFTTAASVHQVNWRVQDLLRTQGGKELDAMFVCPVAPVGQDRTVLEHVDRKPGPGMLWQACVEHGVNLRESWMIGDMVSDILAGKAAGCAGQILVNSEDGPGVLQAVQMINL